MTRPLPPWKSAIPATESEHSKKMETISSAALGETKEIRRVQPEQGRRSCSRIYNSGKSLDKPARLHLSLTDAASLIAAVQYGERHYQHWRCITINLTMLDAPQSMKITLRLLMDHLRHWQERNGVPPYRAWVREQGAVLGDHVHILAAAPPRSGHVLRRNMKRWLCGPTIRGEVTPTTLDIRQTTATGWLGYVCKTVTPTDAAALFAQTGFRIRPEKPGGPVIGQRRGIARCLGPQERKEDAMRAYCEAQHDLSDAPLSC